MKNPKNNRGQIFEGVLLLAAIAIFTYSLYAIFTFEKNVAQEIAPPREIYGMYYSEDNFKIYGEEGSKLLVDQAFSEAINGLSSGKCRTLGDGTAIWENSCIPSSAEFNKLLFDDLENQFRNSFSAYKDYKHKFTIDAGKVRILFDVINLNISTKRYNASYSYTVNFSVQYPITEDPRSVAEIIDKKINDCNKFAEEGMVLDIAGCAKQFTLKSWDSKCSLENVYLKCKLSTKEYYFYNESYRPIEMNLALKI